MRAYSFAIKPFFILHLQYELIMKIFHIITLFSEVIGPYVEASILGKASKNKHIKIQCVDLRRFGIGKHKKVDDTPFGGGPGMVIRVEPVYKAVMSVLSRAQKRKSKTRVILFSTRGKKLTHAVVRRLSKYDELVFICGRYEGVDERVAQYIANEEISIGDYVLSGGELPALVVLEAISRHITGVLGKKESLEENNGSYPTYTKPDVFVPLKQNTIRNWRVPAVLRSGNHAAIEAWRRSHGKTIL